jgi:hypothetical protein
LGCPVSTPLNRNFLNAPGAAFLDVVNATVRHPACRQAVAAPTAAALVALLAALVALFAGYRGGRPISPTPAASASGAPVASIPVSGNSDRASFRIELVVGDEIATATLYDTREARDFAAMLPVSVNMDDPFGQAKTGRLPGELDVEDATRTRSYAAGDLSYWSPSGKLAIVYDALGRSVPPPGLVRLGTVDTGLRAIASSGNDFTMTIRRGQ